MDFFVPTLRHRPPSTPTSLGYVSLQCSSYTPRTMGALIFLGGGSCTRAKRACENLRVFAVLITFLSHFYRVSAVFCCAKQSGTAHYTFPLPLSTCTSQQDSLYSRWNSWYQHSNRQTTEMRDRIEIRVTHKPIVTAAPGKDTKATILLCLQHNLLRILFPTNYNLCSHRNTTASNLQKLINHQLLTFICCGSAKLIKLSNGVRCLSQRSIVFIS